jgi:RNA polymerase sigma-70 factor (ECF subfamily)
MADAAAGREVDLAAKHKARISETVQELLESVSEQDRTLLLMKEVEGLSLKELESIYNVRENALKVRLFRARQRVLKAFEARGSAASKPEATAGKGRTVL